ncbi:MAG: hypothetical protein AMS21_09050 [Gemmatimonas sp. SG8_38_2]|nr:MAG: hypothetical protein AMS21_09050 [Gemmatimonas sp. SG8_38_2]
MRYGRLHFAIVFLLVQVSTGALFGQERALGRYDFRHYYTYDELTAYLTDINEAYPELTTLTSLATSQMGREVWMLVINNPETGAPEEKPGFFVNQIHAGEVIAAASGQYTIWYLLDRYGEDDEVTRIVDNLSLYLVPRLDVDGAEAYLTGMPAGVDPDPVDDDSDGSFDEDPPQDLDGDGFIVQMRQIDPLGEWKVSSEDPRILVRRMADETQGTFYTTYTEGIDDDGDGEYNEDSYSSRFLSNRNYPWNWQPDVLQRGGGSYPMEESITRAEVDFVAANPHIAIYLQHHCCGRIILRPPTTGPDADFRFRNDLEVYQVATARALEHSGWNLATSVFDWDQAQQPGANRKRTQAYRDKEGNIRNAPYGMYPIPENNALDFSDPVNWDQRDRGYFAYGSSLETMYLVFGIFSLADEHWREPDYNWDGLVTEVERLRWNDEELGGAIFIDWHPFEHPTLGDVEIGGWKRSKVSPPEGELVERECEAGNRYTVYLATLAPRVELSIGEVEAIDEQAGLYQLDISVKNLGALRTATEQGEWLGVVEPVRLEVSPSDNVEILSGETRVDLGQINGASESEETTYVFRVTDPASEATVAVSVWSQRAGRDSTVVRINR